MATGGARGALLFTLLFQPGDSDASAAVERVDGRNERVLSVVPSQPIMLAVPMSRGSSGEAVVVKSCVGASTSDKLRNRVPVFLNFF